MKNLRVAVVVSHPIQHFCPQYESWAKLFGDDFQVFFASRQGLDSYVDKEFDRELAWGSLGLEFSHTFLQGARGRQVDHKIDTVFLEKELGGFAPSLVVVYGYSQALQRRAIRWSRRNDVAILMVSDSENRRKRSAVKDVLKSLVLPRVLSKIDLFLTAGDANEQYYRRYGVSDEKFIRASFPIDLNLYKLTRALGGELRVEVRSKYGIKESQKVLLMVGKLVESKRQSDLVKVINKYGSIEKDWTVMLVGSGPDEARLRRMVEYGGESKVIFAGFVDPKELVAYYYAADVYVHCSEVEAHSLAVSEAIFCGRPVCLSNRCGSFGSSDDVQIGVNGFVFKCGNVDELHRVVKLALDEQINRDYSRASLSIADINQKKAHKQAIIASVRALEARGKI